MDSQSSALSANVKVKDILVGEANNLPMYHCTFTET